MNTQQILDRIRELMASNAIDQLPWSVGKLDNLFNRVGDKVFDSCRESPHVGVHSTNAGNAELVSLFTQLAFDLVLWDFKTKTNAMPQFQGLDQLQTDVNVQADRLFPHRTPAKAFMKLYEELGEVIKQPEDASEWADVFIMLLDLTKMFKINNLEEAIRGKMLINENRTWTESPTGTLQHTDDYVAVDPKERTEGAKAFENGLGVNYCIYPIGSTRWMDWFSGYRNAELVSLGESPTWDEMPSAWREGHQAFFCGQSIMTNLYIQRTADANLWYDGWLSGKKEKDREKAVTLGAVVMGEPPPFSGEVVEITVHPDGSHTGKIIKKATISEKEFTRRSTAWQEGYVAHSQETPLFGPNGYVFGSLADSEWMDGWRTAEKEKNNG